jgi:hypothetical protein
MMIAQSALAASPSSDVAFTDVVSGFSRIRD